MKPHIVLTVAAAIATTVAVAAHQAPEPSLVVGAVFTHTVAAGDTIATLGSRFGVPPATLARLNARKAPAPLRVGERILIDNRHVRPQGDVTLVVNVAQRMLFYEGEGSIRAYPIAVGTAQRPTPLGRFTVTAVKAPADEMDRSRSGSFIQLSSGLGIHAATDLQSIYKLSTTGEIRMHPADLVDLQSRLQIGTAGVTIYEPVLAATVSGRIFVEVHEDAYALSHAPMGRLGGLIFAMGATDRVNWPLVEEAFTRKDGIAVDVTTRAWQ